MSLPCDVQPVESIRSGTAATSVGFGVLAEVTVYEVDGVAVTPFQVNANVSDTFNMIDDPGFGSPWDLGLLIELGPALVSHGHGAYAYGVTLGEVVLNNTLAASSETGSAAFIDKKDFHITPGGDLDPNVVPEPTTALIAVLGMAMIALTARRS